MKGMSGIGPSKAHFKSMQTKGFKDVKSDNPTMDAAIKTGEKYKFNTTQIDSLKTKGNTLKTLFDTANLKKGENVTIKSILDHLPENLPKGERKVLVRCVLNHGIDSKDLKTKEKILIILDNPKFHERKQNQTLFNQLTTSTATLRDTQRQEKKENTSAKAAHSKKEQAESAALRATLDIADEVLRNIKQTELNTRHDRL